MKALAFNS